jgi:sugar-specific transcriptional regulator TrmB
MPTLHKKGLIEEVITSPKTFKPIPLKEAYESLLHGKDKENRELKTKVREACKNGPSINPQNINDTQIIMIPSGKAALARMKQEDSCVQKCKDFSIPSEKFLKIIEFIGDNAEKMIKKNVKTRMITEKQAQKAIKNHPEIFTPKLLAKLSFVDFGYTQNFTPVEVIIFDKERLMLSTSKEDNLDKMCWLYSNNQCITEMANNYFETLWATSVKETKKGWLELNKRIPEKIAATPAKLQ